MNSDFRKVRKVLKKADFRLIGTSSNNHYRFEHPSGYILTLGPKFKDMRKVLNSTAKQCRERGIKVSF